MENVPGVKQADIRVGNWLVREQASELECTQSQDSAAGLRDCPILVLLIGCGPRRAEILSLEVNQIQQREGSGRFQTLQEREDGSDPAVPSWVKVRIKEWVRAAESSRETGAPEHYGLRGMRERAKLNREARGLERSARRRRSGTDLHYSSE